MDYPKADDWNRGPISGGMGALSHHPLDTPDLARLIEARREVPQVGPGGERGGGVDADRLLEVRLRVAVDLEGGRGSVQGRIAPLAADR